MSGRRIWSMRTRCPLTSGPKKTAAALSAANGITLPVINISTLVSVAGETLERRERPSPGRFRSGRRGTGYRGCARGLRRWSRGWPRPGRTSCLVARCSHTDGSGDAHRQFEFILAAVARLRSVDHYRQPAPTGVLELAYKQPAGFRRAAPVHVPAVVTRGVVAEGMEREVAGGQVGRDLTFQVPLEASAERSRAR